MRDGRTWLSLFVVVALFAVLGVYYWAHKPVTPEQALVLAASILNLAVAASVVAAAGALGRNVLGRLVGPAGLSAATAGERVTLSAALGLGLIGLIMLALGMAGGLYPLVAWALFAGLLAWLWRDVRRWVADLRAVVAGLLPAGRFEAAAAAFVLLVLVLGLLRALAPPLAWDALVYHLVLPRLYAAAHSVRLDPADFSFFTGMPQLAEMLYTLALLLRLEPQAGLVTAQTLGWLFGLLLALGLAGAAAAMRLPAWLAPAIVFSSFSVSLALAWAYADQLLMLLALAALLAVRLWQHHRAAGRSARSWLLIAGGLAGLAWGTKYTGALVPLGCAAAVLVESIICPTRSQASPGWRGWLSRLRSGVAPASGLGFVAAALMAPWLIKNLLFTGSPVYPLLLPAADVDQQRLWFYSRPDLAESSLLAATTVFVRATLLGRQGSLPFDSSLSPLLLFLPLGLAAAWRRLSPAARPSLRPVIAFSLAAYAGWIALLYVSPLSYQPRLFLSVVPALALVGCAGAVALLGLSSATLRLAFIVNAAIVLVLALSALENAVYFAAHSPLGYLAGAQPASAYRADRLGWHQVALERVNALPAGSRILFLWEARSLGCEAHIRCLPDVVIDRWWYLQRQDLGAAGAVALWRAQGVTHVLLYDLGADFTRREGSDAYEPRDWAELEALPAQLSLVELIGGTYRLFALP
jgi:hypothetical protein